MEGKELITQAALTREQIDLIKHTVAIGASDNELQLFLYQANKRGLDPLTRQIHFIKRKQYNPDIEKYDEVGTIQTGIDGFRVIADRTGKLSGISRGVIRNEKGELIGAWAEVYRSDWEHSAREEVSFNEYCQRKKDGSPMRLWATMPETMIKKVAEAAALRMAFPEDLSGIYTHDEMYQANTEAEPLPEPKAKLQTQPDDAPQSKPEAVKEETSINLPDEPEETTLTPSRVDMQWLKETLGIIRWKESTALSWIKSQLKVEGTNLAEVLNSLSDKELEIFINHISAMRDASGA